MDFISNNFLLFTILSILLYYLIPIRYRAFHLLLVNSVFIFLFGEVTFIYVFFVVVLTFVGGFIINKYPDKRIIFYCFITIIVTGLIYFKYPGFIIKNIDVISNFIAWNYSRSSIALLVPIGISFYTFQALGYLLDVKNKKIPFENNFLVLANFLMFFPKFASGPIEKPTHFFQEMKKEKKFFNYDYFSRGVKIATWGFFKKMVIADRLAAYTNEVFNNVSEYKGMSLILIIFFFSFQIYADFSGYTDIAIGISLMFGYKLTDNFRQPYLATSIKIFWSRWHITLSNWVKEYIFLPVAYKFSKYSILK